MKKFIAIVLIILFAANICGASISHHYCGKILQYSSLNGQKKKSKCCCGGTQKKKGCCHTKHQKVKIEKEQSFSAKVFFEKHFTPCILPELYYSASQNIFYHGLSTIAVPLANSPPFVRTVPIYIEIRQFLI